MKLIAALSLGLLLILMVGCAPDNHFPVPTVDTNTVDVRVDGKIIATIYNVVQVVEDGSNMRTYQMIDGKTKCRVRFFQKDDTEWDFVEAPIPSIVSDKPPVETKTTPAVVGPQEG